MDGLIQQIRPLCKGWLTISLCKCVRDVAACFVLLFVFRTTRRAFSGVNFSTTSIYAFIARDMKEYLRINSIVVLYVVLRNTLSIILFKNIFIEKKLKIKCKIIWSINRRVAAPSLIALKSISYHQSVVKLLTLQTNNTRVLKKH